MKSLKLCSLVFIFCFFFVTCKKDELPIVRSDSAIIELRGSEGPSNLNYNIVTNCATVMAGVPNYTGGPRVKTAAINQVALNAFLQRMVNSGSFEWSDIFQKTYGVPYAEMSLFSRNSSIETVKLPIFSNEKKEITSFYTITEVNSQFQYTFVEREMNHLFLNNDPNNPILLANKKMFSIFDYGACNSDIDPNFGSPNDIQENNPCIVSTGTAMYLREVDIPCECEGCIACFQEVELDFVTYGPCNGGGGNGSGSGSGGAVGGGGNGGGFYYGGVTSSGNNQLATATYTHNGLKILDPRYVEALTRLGVSDFDQLLNIIGPPGDRLGPFMRATNAYNIYNNAGNHIPFDDIVNGGRLWYSDANPNSSPAVLEINNNISITSAEVQTSYPPEANYKGGTPNRGNTEDLAYGFGGFGPTGDIELAGKTVPQLFAEMRDLMTDFSVGALETVALDLVDYFDNNTSSTNVYSNNTLSMSVMESPQMRNFVKRYGAKLNDELKTNNNFTGSVEMFTSERPIFNTYVDRVSGLQICINDTEETRVYRSNFNFNPGTKEWSCDLTIVIDDHFGLDNNDVRSYQFWNEGFAAWWRLQKLHGQVPFHTHCILKYHISGKAQ